MATLAIVLAAAPVLAQDADGEDLSLKDRWANLLHYLKVARPELAQKHGLAILEGGYEAKDIYAVARQFRESRQELSRGLKQEAVKDVAKDLLEAIESGYNAYRSDPEEIARNIELLGQSLYEYRAARDRLTKISGQYAVPQLIQKLREPESVTGPLLKERIITILPALGKEGVRPLSVALQTDSAELQVTLCRALGEIGYPHAAPRIKERLQREGIPDAGEKAARTALVACAGEDAFAKPLPELFYDLGEKYYYRAESLMPDSRYPTANVWYWSEERGVTFRQVPREVFCDVYTMRNARLALKHNPTFYKAVPLWLSGILNKAANMPEGAGDPTWPADLRGAEFYIRAASAKFQQDVLARALRDRNTPVAKGAISALGDTAGAESMVKPVAGGAQPMVEAMTYPALSVRLLAALALAGATPQKGFAGDDLVMPTLNEAIRLTASDRAVLIAGNQNTGNQVQQLLRDDGWQVARVDDVDAAAQAARDAGGADLVVLVQHSDALLALKKIRLQAALLNTPVLVVLTPAEKAIRYRGLARAVLAEKATEEAIGQALGQAVQMAPKTAMPAEEAADWAIRAAEKIRLLGRTAGTIYPIDRTRPTLLEATESDSTDVQLAAASALAVMPDETAQQGIVKLGLDGTAEVAAQVQAMQYATESVRRFGNKLTDELAQRVLDVVKGDGPGELRDAAARLLGALNLPSERIQSLIVETAVQP